MMQSKTGAIPPDGGTLPSANLADDILLGANQIAEFLFGNRGARRKVYHLVEKSHLPYFRFGSVLCARKSILITWIEEQERRAVQGVVER
jgi:hypothetical protein